MEAVRGGKILISVLLTVLVSQSLVTLAKCRSLEAPDTHALNSQPRPQPSNDESKCECDTPPPPPRGACHPPPPRIPVRPQIPIIYTPSPPPPYIPLVPTPTTPTISTPPSPPYVPVDPNNPGGTPGTCTYWSTNPAMIWGIFGSWATIGTLFGPSPTLPLGSNLSVRDALSNTRTDGFGTLYREGTASYLNSVVNKKFPFSTEEVRNAFVSSLVSEKAAAKQAQIFKLANKGRLKKH